MVQPLTYDYMDNKIKEMILPISPNSKVSILALELSSETKLCKLICWNSKMDWSRV